MLKVKIYSLKEKILDTETPVLSLHGTEGALGIMEGHEEMIIELKSGPHKVTDKGKDYFFYTLNGIASIEKEGVSIFAVKTILSETALEADKQDFSIKPLHHKEVDYELIYRNIIKNFPEKLWKAEKKI